MKPWLKYSLIRLGVFVIVLVVLLFIGVPPVLATIIAAVVGLCVAYIFFGKLRAEMTADLIARRASAAAVVPRDADSAAEDAEIEDAGR